MPCSSTASDVVGDVVFDDRDGFACVEEVAVGEETRTVYIVLPWMYTARRLSVPRATTGGAFDIVLPKRMV